MQALPKIRRILDEEHLEYVRRQSCMDCQCARLSLDPAMTARRRRMSDPHHLRSISYPRRFFDWLTVPLCRYHHSCMDAPDGPSLEKRKWPRLVRMAGLLMYSNGRITSKRYDKLVKCGEDADKIKAWIDTLVKDGQNWDGGSI